MSAIEVPTPILNSPFEGPKHYWYIREGEEPQLRDGRRKSIVFPPQNQTDEWDTSDGTIQKSNDPASAYEMVLVNLIRERVTAWRDQGYPGASRTSLELLEYWRRGGRHARLFYAQLEAAETIIFLNESRSDFRQGIAVPLDDPSTQQQSDGVKAFVRYGCKMATGSGKTTVMGMIAAWSILNKIANRTDGRYSDVVFVVCPNVTIRSRLSELYPEAGEASVYRKRDLVPPQLMPSLRQGKVLVTNWHVFELQTPQTGEDGTRIASDTGDQGFRSAGGSEARRRRKVGGSGQCGRQLWEVAVRHLPEAGRCIEGDYGGGDEGGSGGSSSINNRMKKELVVIYSVKDLTISLRSPLTVVSIRCPACKQIGTFDPVFATNTNRQSGLLDMAAQNNQGVVLLTLGQRVCPNPACAAHVFFVFDDKKCQIAVSYPAERIDFDTTNVPKPIVSALEEAITCHANQCFVAAAIMVRKTLEELCSARGAQGSNLKDRIKALGVNVVLPSDLMTGLDDLRLLGNDAAHIESKEYAKVDQEEVEVAIEFSKEVLKAVYQYAALLGRLKALKKKP